MNIILMTLSCNWETQRKKNSTFFFFLSPNVFCSVMWCVGCFFFSVRFWFHARMFIETFRRNFNCNTINKPALTMPPDAFCHSRFTVFCVSCISCCVRFFVLSPFNSCFIEMKNTILISSEKCMPLSRYHIENFMFQKKFSLHTWSRVFDGFTSCHDHYCVLLHTENRIHWSLRCGRRGVVFVSVSISINLINRILY